MNNKELATKIIEHCGGASNIVLAFNCLTRVRIDVKDKSLINFKAIEKLTGVMGVVDAGNQIQVVVGPGKSTKLAQACNVILEASGGSRDTTTAKVALNVNTKSDDKAEFKKQYLATKEFARKKSRGSALFKKISGIFVPIIPAFIACGLLLAILEIVKTQIPTFVDTKTGIILNVISSSVFSVLSIVVGYNACKQFGGDAILGACLAGILSSPLLGSIDKPLFDWGIIKIYGGLGGIISVLFVAIAAAYFEKLLRKFMPNILDTFLTPLLTLAVMSVVGLFACMPVGGLISKGIEISVTAICKHVPYLLGVVPAFYLLMVLFGVHHVLIAVSQSLIDSTAVPGVSPGYSILTAVQLMAGAAEVGAAIYFLVTSKNKKMKTNVIESLPIGFLGIDEPLIWGMTFNLKRLFIPIGIAGAASGSILAIILSKLHAGALVPETTGIEASLLMSNNTAKWVYAIIFITAIVLGFICTALIGYKENVQINDEKTGKVMEIRNETSVIYKFYQRIKARKQGKNALASEAVLSNIIYSPLDGKVVPLSSLADKTFANKVIGDGIAIIPTSGKIYAPVNGTISALLDTKHAYGITAEGGFEILVHIGQDTVKLNGEHFTTNVTENAKIKQGDFMGEFNIRAIKAKGYNMATPVIITAPNGYEIVSKTKMKTIKVGQPLIELKKIDQKIVKPVTTAVDQSIS